MKKGCMVVASILMGTLVLAGCGKVDNTNPNPSDYIELGQYKGLEYVMPSAEVSDGDIEDELNYLASGYATQETVTDGTVQNGDTVNIDYTGKKDGDAFEGGSAEGFDLSIGSGVFIPGFEEGLIGTSSGETVDLNLTFPEDYQAADLAGADVVFTVKINEIKRSKLPEINDAFIQEISQGQYSTLDEYKIALEEQMKVDNAEYAELQIYTDLMSMAVENATIKKDIPEEYVQTKVSRLLINSQQMAKEYGVDYETFLSQYMQMTPSEFNTQSVEYARTAAKQSLVLMAIANAENISVSDEELQQGIDEYVQQYGYASEEEFKASTNMDDFKEYILTSKVEEFLVQNAVIK